MTNALLYKRCQNCGNEQPYDDEDYPLSADSGPYLEDLVRAYHGFSPEEQQRILQILRAGDH